jgi:hypothetical protein
LLLIFKEEIGALMESIESKEQEASLTERQCMRGRSLDGIVGRNYLEEVPPPKAVLFKFSSRE